MWISRGTSWSWTRLKVISPQPAYSNPISNLKILNLSFKYNYFQNFVYNFKVLAKNSNRGLELDLDWCLFRGRSLLYSWKDLWRPWVSWSLSVRCGDLGAVAKTGCSKNWPRSFWMVRDGSFGKVTLIEFWSVKRIFSKSRFQVNFKFAHRGSRDFVVHKPNLIYYRRVV